MFGARKRSIDSNNQAIVIPRVEGKTFNIDVANGVATSNWTFPKHKINAGTYTGTCIIVCLKVRARRVDGVHYFETVIKQMLKRKPS